MEKSVRYTHYCILSYRIHCLPQWFGCHLLLFFFLLLHCSWCRRGCWWRRNLPCCSSCRCSARLGCSCCRLQDLIRIDIYLLTVVPDWYSDIRIIPSPPLAAVVFSGAAATAAAAFAGGTGVGLLSLLIFRTVRFGSAATGFSWRIIFFVSQVPLSYLIHLLFFRLRCSSPSLSFFNLNQILLSLSISRFLPTLFLLICFSEIDSLHWTLFMIGVTNKQLDLTRILHSLYWSRFCVYPPILLISLPQS